MPSSGLRSRRIAGQLLQMQAVGGAVAQAVFDDVNAMDRRPIPDHGDVPGDLVEQRAQESHHPLSVVCLLLEVEVEVASERDATDDREMVPRERDAQHRGSGRPAPRCGPPAAADSTPTRLPRRWWTAFRRPLFDGGSALLAPLSQRGVVALGCAGEGLLPTPAQVPQQGADMIARIAHPNGLPDDLGNAARRPDVAAKAVAID